MVQQASVVFAPGCVVAGVALSLSLSGASLAEKSLRWCLRAEREATLCRLPLTAVFEKVGGGGHGSQLPPPLLAEVTVQVRAVCVSRGGQAHIQRCV